MRNGKTLSGLKNIAFIGNYLPRQCGIATFTTDLCEAVASNFPEVHCLALPVTDTEEGYNYPPRVRFEILERDLTSYRRAADFLNINDVDVVCLQHEYGIFGGKAGSYILTLLRELRAPIVTTLHTILKDPSPDQRRVLEEIVALSDRVVAMSHRGVEFLRTIYSVPEEKIDLIPHGIPDVPFLDPSFYKDRFGVEGKIVLLTFGLLSANKGIENVIAALPRIVERYPNVVYIVLGATHPNVRRHEGETYRLYLQRLAYEKGVEGNVIFYNRFVSLQELLEFIGAADFYITPYLNPAQITSGTLAYSVGAGKAVISTPYWHAEELLADGRGVLVPFRTPDALAESVLELLDDEPKRQAMRKRAYLYARDMVWQKVACRYMESFERARAEHMHQHRFVHAVKTLEERPRDLPLLNLNHLQRMTDDTGMLQHAVFTVPNYKEGYTTDDNARALIVTTYLEDIDRTQAFELGTRYLAFLWNAYNEQTKRFRNFMDYRREWREKNGSDDSHARALHALGCVLGRSSFPSFQRIAGRLFEQALPAILETTSPRAWAYALIGIDEYLRRFTGDRMAKQVRDELAQRLHRLYSENSDGTWKWYEQSLSYCNAVLPHAMIITGASTQNEVFTTIGVESLQWLSSIQRADNGSGDHFVPIGSNGFYVRGKERARFDQQPVEAQTYVSACLAAYQCTHDEHWLCEARRAFEWFLGRNDLKLSLYDPTTGGCRDGLHFDRANENQGAESTLAFLQALLELKHSEETVPTLEEHYEEHHASGTLSTL